MRKGGWDEWLDRVGFQGPEIAVMVDILTENPPASQRMDVSVDRGLRLTCQYWLLASNRVVR